MMSGTSWSLIISIAVIAKAVQLSAQVTTSKESFDFMVMVMQADDSGIFDFNILMDLQRKWFDYQSLRAKLDTAFNLDLQTLVQDYSKMANTLSALNSASMLGNPNSMLDDHFKAAYDNLTSTKQANAQRLLENYQQAVKDYLAPKGAQTMAYASTLISAGLGSYGQFVMRLGSYLSQLDMEMRKCVEHCSETSSDAIEVACFQREVKILEDFIYQLIQSSTAYLEKQRQPAYVEASTDAPTLTTTSTVDVAITLLSSTPSAIGSGSGDEGDMETTNVPNPHLLPFDDEDYQQSTPTVSEEQPTEARDDKKTETGETTTTSSIVIHEQPTAHGDSAQVDSTILTAESRNIVEKKGHHKQDTVSVDGSITITSGSNQALNNSITADIILGLSNAPMGIALFCSVVGALVVVFLVTAISCIIHLRRSRQRSKGHIPLTEEEVVEGMKKNGFVNPTYTFFSK